MDYGYVIHPVRNITRAIHTRLLIFAAIFFEIDKLVYPFCELLLVQVAILPLCNRSARNIKLLGNTTQPLVAPVQKK